MTEASSKPEGAPESRLAQPTTLNTFKLRRSKWAATRMARGEPEPDTTAKASARMSQMPEADDGEVHDIEHPVPGPRRRRGIYLLPNLFTTGNLFAGFYAIVMAMNGRFEHAAIAIFVAMFFDGMDGRVARLTNSQSAFGEQYDSLADVLSFGAAPALVIYSWAMTGMGQWGWLAAFVYVAGAALRLARFNTNLQVVDKRFFQGLPSPAAAALVAGLVWVATDWRDANWIVSTGADLGWLAWIMTVYAGLSMVSNSPFYSFKDFNLRRSVPFVVLILIMLALVLVSSDPPSILFLLFTCYGVSGHVALLLRRQKKKQAQKQGRASA